MFFKRRKPSPPPARPLIAGRIDVGGRRWDVREERRQGPREQILILTDPDGGGAEMHIRPMPGDEARTLEDVEGKVADPTDRWFRDRDGHRWEVRIVIAETTNRRLLKFISWEHGVYEGPLDDSARLGLLADSDLTELLEQVRRGG